MTRGARHNYGQSNQPFRNPPAGSRLERIWRAVFPSEAEARDPLGVTVAQYQADRLAHLRELFAARMPKVAASVREAWAQYVAKGEAECFRLALGGEPPRRPGRPANDPFLCFVALEQSNLIREAMPGASQDRLYSETAAALGPGITKRQVRSAVQAAGPIVAHWGRTDIEPPPPAEAAENAVIALWQEAAQDAVIALWQEAVRGVARDACPQQPA